MSLSSDILTLSSPHVEVRMMIMKSTIIPIMMLHAASLEDGVFIISRSLDPPIFKIKKEEIGVSRPVTPLYYMIQIPKIQVLGLGLVASLWQMV